MNEFLAKLPSTNFRIFVGVMLAVVLVLYVILAQIAVGIWEKEVLLPEPYTKTLLGFVVLITGIDAAQFIAKRVTHKEGVGEGDA